MRKTLIALALAIGPAGAYAKPHHPAQYHDMSQAEFDALNAKWDAEAKPGYKNCMREYDDVKRNGPPWTGPPSQADCIAFAEAVRQKGVDMIDEGLKGLMETK